jgi:hypothetical protein
MSVEENMSFYQSAFLSNVVWSVYYIAIDLFYYVISLHQLLQLVNLFCSLLLTDIDCNALHLLPLYFCVEMNEFNTK